MDLNLAAEGILSSWGFVPASGFKALTFPPSAFSLFQGALLVLQRHRAVLKKLDKALGVFSFYLFSFFLSSFLLQHNGNWELAKHNWASCIKKKAWLILGNKKLDRVSSYDE
jgi:hypothetical protein